MMDNIPNLRLEVLIDYVLTKRNVCSMFEAKQGTNFYIILFSYHI